LFYNNKNYKKKEVIDGIWKFIYEEELLKWHETVTIYKLACPRTQKLDITKESILFIELDAGKIIVLEELKANYVEFLISKTEFLEFLKLVDQNDFMLWVNTKYQFMFNHLVEAIIYNFESPNKVCVFTTTNNMN